MIDLKGCVVDGFKGNLSLVLGDGDGGNIPPLKVMFGVIVHVRGGASSDRSLTLIYGSR